ncbi:MAG TPA: hypothetical protein DEO94_02290 [Cyanobacteria bacterium UBA11991]|nr:hypothetical protein [Cyanobacteriota bacterium]MDY6358621.1 hypothetical protein [Cyanobacteriota bacterium]MDY6363724.1 hypothetical protein [Cyanobacteriota bacterium]HCB10978.1 hypothetical protein [Cyanobacteria bacterium UBA11991]
MNNLIKKLFVIFLLFVQSFLLGANAHGLNTYCNHIDLNTKYICHEYNNFPNKAVFTNFKTNETAVLTVNNMLETLTSMRNNDNNAFGSLHNALSNTETKVNLILSNAQTAFSDADNTYSHLSNVINTRAP